MKCYSFSLYFACLLSIWREIRPSRRKYSSLQKDHDEVLVRHCLLMQMQKLKGWEKHQTIEILSPVTMKILDTFLKQCLKIYIQFSFILQLIITHNYLNLYHRFTVVHLIEEHMFSASPFKTAAPFFTLYLHSYICVR